MHQNTTEEKQGRGLTRLLKNIFPSVPPEKAQLLRDARLQVNVSRMHAFSIFIFFLQLTLNLINILKPADSQGEHIMMYVILSLTMLAVSIVYWILFHLVKKKFLVGDKPKIFLVHSLLYIYLLIQLAFCTLNILTNNGINSYIIAILIVSLFPILPPAQSVPTILLTFAYVMLTLFFTRNIADTWRSVITTDTWANLIIVTSISLFAAVFINNIYSSDFLQKLRLEETNKSLQRANDELGRLNSQLEIIATTDQMTGMANRYAFARDFDEIWRTAASKQNRIAMAIMDIDFFKSYNDAFGHLEGDICLQKVADSLKASFRRNNDIVVRFGGEEFLAVFSADREDAFELGEKARINVESMKIPHGNTAVSPYVTISVGVCVTTPGPGISTDRAIKIADDALYASKQGGRNRTTIREYLA